MKDIEGQKVNICSILKINFQTGDLLNVKNMIFIIKTAIEAPLKRQTFDLFRQNV